MRWYIALNCLAVIGLPLIIIWFGTRFPDLGPTATITSQGTAILTGVLGLQKLLSAWYASQQRYASWFKSASDLKTIYYGFIQSWDAGRAAANPAGFAVALETGTAAARKVISDEQLDYYQKLALPSFDILDLLTSGKSAVSGLVGSLVPGNSVAVAAAGKNALVSPRPGPQRPPAPTATSAGSAGYLLLPGGLLHRSRVYKVGPGGQLPPLPADVTPLRSHPAPGAPDYSNWITCGYLNTGKRVTRFASTWVVPEAPTNRASQLIYLFNGLEPADGSLIVQPVLLWGDCGLDNDRVDRGGQYWSVASFIVTGNTGHHTDLVRVNPGDHLTGVITLISEQADRCIYSCEFQGIPGTCFVTDAIPPLTYCAAALEAYELNDRPRPYDLDGVDEYPASAAVVFSNIDVTTDSADPPGMWSRNDWAPRFGETTTFINNGTPNVEVTISFG